MLRHNTSDSTFKCNSDAATAYVLDQPTLAKFLKEHPSHSLEVRKRKGRKRKKEEEGKEEEGKNTRHTHSRCVLHNLPCSVCVLGVLLYVL